MCSEQGFSLHGIFAFGRYLNRGTCFKQCLIDNFYRTQSVVNGIVNIFHKLTATGGNSYRTLHQIK